MNTENTGTLTGSGADSTGKFGEIIGKSLGTDHPNYASSLNHLAALYDSMGQYEQARGLKTERVPIIFINKYFTQFIPGKQEGYATTTELLPHRLLFF